MTSRTHDTSRSGLHPEEPESLNRVFRETLPAIFSGIAVLLGFLAAINFSFFPEGGYGVPLTELGLALVFAGAWAAVRGITLPLRLVNPVAVCAAWLVLASNLVHFAATQDAWKSAQTTLIIVGVGSLLLSRAWFVVTILGIYVSWYLVARRIVDAYELKIMAYSMFAATGLAALIQEARIRIYRRLESLRLQDLERKVDLQLALEATGYELEERLKIETALRESEARYRLLVDTAPVAIVVHVKGRARFVNQAVLKLIGIQQVDDLIGKSVLQFVHPEDQPMASERIQRVLELNKPGALGELRMIRSDGEIIEVEAASAPISFEGERASQIVLLDVTQRKRTDDRLRIMQFAIDHAGEALLWMDHQTRIVYANIQACEILDYTMKELLELRLGDLDPQFAEESSAFGERSLEWGKTVTLERRFRRRDKSEFSAEITVNRLGHESLDVYIIFIRDITERKLTDAALRESEERFRTVFEEGPLGMALIDTQLRFSRANAMFCQLLDMSHSELMGMSLYDLSLPSIEESHREAVARLIRGEVESIELNMKWEGAKKREVWVRIIATLIRNQSGEGLYGLAMVEDVTRARQAESEKQRLEDQLRQAQKMEAVGTLAGGIAHDFNNLLTGILGYANILKSKAKADSKVYEAAEVIERAGERARDLTNQLLGFARKGKNQNVAINLDHTVRDVVTLLNRTIHKSIRIRQIFDTGPFYVQGDPNQLEQVFLNLALNARDAMPDGGDLTFEGRLVTLDRSEVQKYPDTKPGEHVEVSVTDTGTGIPPDFMERIFEPFFTTKEFGQGTGMGLAMVYGIVHNHGGFVRVESDPGSGSTFRVLLPSHHAGISAELIPESEVTLSGQGRILVVDDEEIVRRLLHEMLNSLGYEVVLASSGREALAYYEKFSSEIDLAIIDMVMPDMSGRECFRAFRAINPGIRAILATGYGRDGAAQEIMDEGMVGFAQKPLRINQLSQLVARALTASVSSVGEPRSQDPGAS
jgi:PAS domain S-box-containing protein